MNLYFQLCSYSMILRVLTEVGSSRAGFIDIDCCVRYTSLNLKHSLVIKFNASLKNFGSLTDLARRHSSLLPVTAAESSAKCPLQARSKVHKNILL